MVLFLALPLCAQVKFTQGKDRIAVEIDGKPYADFFLAADGNKPYVYPLRTASGILVTRHFPMEEFPGETKDHPHQRGMFFSHGEVNGYNFWATEASVKNPKQARMALKKVAEAKGVDVVVEANNTLFFKAALDITSDALVAYDKAYPAK